MTGVEVVVLPVGTSTTNLVRGVTRQLLAAPHDANNLFVNTAVVWASSDAAKATVSATGLVTIGTGAAAGGDVNITATAGGQVGTFPLNVQHPITAVVLTPVDQTIRREGTVALTAGLTDAAGVAGFGRTVTWASSNTAVATVNSSGVVSGVTDGVVTITATVNNTGDVANVLGTTTVTVSGAPLVASVAVTAPATFGGITQTIQATHASSAASGTVIAGTTATWSSSATSVATVSATGLVTLVGEGTASIRADVDDGTGTLVRGTLTIRSAPILVSGVGTPSGTIASGTSKYWALVVPAGGAGISVTSDAGATGDGDLFLLVAGVNPSTPPAGGFGTIPPILCGTNGGCFSGASGNTEAISRTGANALAEGTYPIAYHAWTGGGFTEPVTGVTLTATITP
ncbi:MAG: Ig-like domain-containing protein [Gemmatimonadaceae bacterium]